MSTEVYKYYNPNPDAKLGKRWHRDDCVIRAFACALRKTWTEVYREICETGLKMFDIPLSQRVIATFAKQHGMTKVSLPDYMTIGDFAKAFDRGVYICNPRSHLVCVKNGQVYDTWDCSNYKIKTYYTFTKM